MTAITTAPTVREILAAGQCSASCILSSLETHRCGCRRLGQYHGIALAALGLLSQPGAATGPETPGKPRTRRKHRRKSRG